MDGPPPLEVDDRDNIQGSGMRILVYEHITGGGMCGTPLPHALAQEGDLMLRALVGDLSELCAVSVCMTRDARLPHDGLDAQVYCVENQAELQRAWTRLLDEVDAVWPIAPETGGLLARLSQEVLEAGPMLLGSRPAAVALTGSKFRTAHALTGHGIPVIPTYRPGAELPAQVQTWVLKPDQGVGCEGLRICPAETLDRYWPPGDDTGGWVAQPCLSGGHASLCALFDTGRARLLSLNRQRLARRGDGLELQACIVNGLEAARGPYEQLAGRIASAIPGLWGIAGVDLIVTPAGPVVVEINPRLTSSYAGLHRALDFNPAGAVLALLEGTLEGAMAPLVPGHREVVVEALHGD